MTFTLQASPEVEAKIAADLRLIVEEVLALLGRDAVFAILLTGGFGRGEGSVFRRDGTVRIVNDYDLAIVPRSQGRLAYISFYRAWQGKLERLAQDLAARLHLKQVDLGLKPREYFTCPKELRIENYEVKTGHVLLHGEEDPCNEMPDWRAEDLPLFDGTWLFRNRGFGLLIARLYLWEREDVAKDDREKFFIECNKAWLAIGDSLLLERRLYHFRHAERLARARRFASDPLRHSLWEGYCAALEWKLAPDESRLEEAATRRRWERLARDFVQFFLGYENRRLGTNAVTWVEYSRLPLPEDRINWRTFVGEILRNRGRIPPAVLKANRAQNVTLIGLLLSSSIDGTEGRLSLAAARSMLGLPRNGGPSAWLEAVLATFRLVHPGGEVARLLHRFQTIRA